jgi:putative ABC transport system substrate-binding protein
MRRIGVLMPLARDDSEAKARLGAFVEALEQLGWVDGRNVRIDTRWTAGDPDDIRKYAAEFASHMPDVMLATGASTTGAAETDRSKLADHLRSCSRSCRRGLR